MVAEFQSNLNNGMLKKATDAYATDAEYYVSIQLE